METSTWYVTKYALTKGIMRIEVSESDFWSYGEATCIRYKENGYPLNFRVNKEVFNTLEAAKQKADELRNKKVWNLTKQINKLVDMEF